MRQQKTVTNLRKPEGPVLHGMLQRLVSRRPGPHLPVRAAALGAAAGHAAPPDLDQIVRLVGEW